MDTRLDKPRICCITRECTEVSMPYRGKDKNEIMHTVMKRYKEGKQHAGKGGHLAESRKQAIAIAISEGKKYGSK